jgi:hypothetical protein
LYGALEHDGPPTQGMREVRGDLDRELAAQRAALDNLSGKDVARLNALAKEQGIPFIVD